MGIGRLSARGEPLHVPCSTFFGISEGRGPEESQPRMVMLGRCLSSAYTPSSNNTQR
jgi:hypothetical protein